MKKFLSLVLAMIMTLSLVTISAGATEYKDLTDKDEIKYEEAVAVLNRIGIITGYSDGSFRPETELTRGAAAKIIVSLLIGSDAANNLTVPVAPYPDVPTSHTFAAVISYCKTAKIISGYSDGTFKPDGSLTGYAFAKMLLGAIGYKSELEGFSGSGWTMNVAKIGNAAGLFNRLDFQGGEPVNREQACQLALNTLKATMVEYTGGFNVVAGDATIVGAQNRSFVTSNQSYAANILNKKVSNTGNNTSSDSHFTVEFGEEHFKDLRLNYDGNTNDDFGRPANSWSWKKVTIGTFPIDADFSYDKLMEHRDKTSAAKNRATGLSGYKTEVHFWNNTLNTQVDVFTNIWMNGYLLNGNEGDEYTLGNDNHTFGIADICDLTDNGTTVDVYVSEDNADFITDVVVVKSQLMEVKKVGSDYVSLQMYDNSTSDDEGTKDFPGFNQNAINLKVANVQAEDAPYAVLKDLKAEDRVVVIPVADDHASNDDWNVAEAYKPETVSGALTAVGDYGPTNSKKNAISLTVGGTVYNVSLWSKDINDIDGEKIKVTKKDVTLTLDKYGYAMLAEDVGATNDFMVVGSFRSGIESGRIVTYVTGWDISGNAIELNIGPNFNKDTSGIRPGDLVKYTSATNSNITDWNISETADVYNVFTGTDSETADDYRIKASNVKVDLRDYDGDENALYIDKSIKFIYVTFDVDGEVESIEVKKGVQAVENKELRTTGANYNNRLGVDGGVIVNATPYASTPKHINNYNSAQACVKSNAIKAVVIKQESNDAISSAMLYVRDMPGGAEYDSEGKMVYKYTVAMNGKDGLVDDEMTIYSYDRLYRGDFASYAEMTNEKYDKTPFYDLRQHNNFVGRTTSTFQATIKDIVDVNKGLVELMNYSVVDAINGTTGSLPGDPQLKTATKATLGLGHEQNIASVLNAEFVDLSGNDIDSYDDLKVHVFRNLANNTDEKVRQNQLVCQLVINDNPDNDGFRKVAMVIISRSNVAPDNTKAANDTLTSASIKGVTASMTAGTEGTPDTAPPVVGTAGANTVNLTYAQANSDARIRFEHNGDKIKVEHKTSVGSYADVTDNTMKLADGDKIKVTVTAINGNYNIYEYTINVAALKYDNTTAQSHSTAQSYSAGDWTSNAVDAVKIDSNGHFAFPFLNTGVENDTKAQILEAIQYYNVAHPGAPQFSEDFSKVADGVWNVSLDGTPFQFLESSATKVLAKVAGATTTTEYAVTTSAAVSTLTGGTDAMTFTGHGSVTPVGGTEAPLTSADGTGDTVIPGATYKAEVYTEFDSTACTIAANTTTTNFTFGASTLVGAPADVTAGNVVAVGTSLFAKQGATLQTTMEVTTITSAVANLKLTPAAGSSTLTAGAAVDIDADIEIGDSLTVTWTVGAPAAKVSSAPTVNVA